MSKESTSNNEFVKRQQEGLMKMVGKKPVLKPEATKFDAYMCNTGEKAQEFAKKLTSGLDKTAFPVK